VGAAVLGLSIAPRVNAAPQDLFGFGARSSAMGMTAAASSEGYEAIYGNPGLLAETRKKSLTLGIGIARHALYADTSSQLGGRELTLPTDEMKTIYIGAALPIPFGGFLKDRITFGVGFLNPAKFLVRGKILYPERYQYPIVAPRVQSIAVAMGLGARIGNKFYLGAGFEALAGVIGEILISLDATGRVGSRTDDQVIAAYAPIFSAALDVTDHIRVGITYRGELVGRFALTIRASDLGINLPDFNVAGVAQYIPEQLAFEARWSSNKSGAPIAANQKGTRVALGLLARRWSKYPGPNEPTVLANTDFGTGVDKAHAFQANDTISPRVGVEHAIPISAAAGVRLRGGYALEPTPLREQTWKENFLDSTRHVLTAGAGLLGDESLPFQIDLFAQLHVLQSRTHTKETEAGQLSVTSGGTIAVVGMTAGVRF
jgi:long-chain fatty acid transport protein